MKETGSSISLASQTARAKSWVDRKWSATSVMTIGIMLLLCAAANAVSFPLTVSANKRYLVDQQGNPFFAMGDAGWSMTTQITYAQANQYLTDRAARGFNLILVNLIEHKYADHAPANIYNVPPFTGAAFATPNEAYFSLCDSMVNRANQLSIVLYLDPLYLGWQCGVEGWCADVQAASLATMKSWGAYVGNRYKNYPNIIWVIGGDTDPSTVRAKVDSVVAGIKSTDTQYPGRLVTGHATYGQTATFFPESWLGINGTYSWTPSAMVALNDAAYDRTPVLPTMFIEGFYENENSVTTQGLRAQAYWSVLRGGMGHIFGNSPMWQFGSATFGGVPRDWVAALGSPGAVSMTHFRNLFNSIGWHRLIPDRTAKVITAGALTGTSQATFAYTSDSVTIVGYLPSSRAVTINPAVLKGDSVSVSWFNPANGVTTAGGRVSKTSRSYTPPSAGDWVLLLSSRCCSGVTGNVDCSVDGRIDISDLTALMDNLFVNLTPLCCRESANTDGSIDGIVDISDLTRLIDHLYINLSVPELCR